MEVTHRQETYKATKFHPGNMVVITSPHYFKSLRTDTSDVLYNKPLWVLKIDQNGFNDDCYVLGRAKGKYLSKIPFSWYDDELTFYSDPDLTDSEIEESGESVDILIK